MNRYVSLFFLFLTTFCFALNPVKEYVEHPANFDFKYEEIKLETEDGYSLNSWLCLPSKAVSNNTVLVVAYGDAGNMSYLLRQVDELVKNGFTILLFDYRGFGESQSFLMNEKQLYYDEFTIDLKSALEFASKRFKGSKIGLWTLSMGAIMGTLTADSNLFSFMVSEGFVSDPNVIVEKLKEYKDEVYLLPRSSSHYSEDLSKLSIPVLLFAGDRDGLTTVEESQRVAFLNPKSETVLFKGGHLQGFQALSGTFHGEKYIKSITNFVKKL